MPGQETIKSVSLRVDKLERFIAKLCHYTGQQNLLLDFKIPKWEPGKEDMSKYAEPEKKKTENTDGE